MGIVKIYPYRLLIRYLINILTDTFPCENKKREDKKQTMYENILF